MICEIEGRVLGGMQFACWWRCCFARVTARCYWAGCWWRCCFARGSTLCARAKLNRECWPPSETEKPDLHKPSGPLQISLPEQKILGAGVKFLKYPKIPEAHPKFLLYTHKFLSCTPKFLKYTHNSLNTGGGVLKLFWAPRR